MNLSDSGVLRRVETDGGALITMDSALSGDKYSVAAIRAREVVSLNASYKSERKPELRDRLIVKLDALLGFLMSQFKSMPSDEEVRIALADNELNALNENELGSMPDRLVPLAIMRELMKKQRLMVDVRGLENWSYFEDRYQTQILHA